MKCEYTNCEREAVAHVEQADDLDEDGDYSGEVYEVWYCEFHHPKSKIDAFKTDLVEITDPTDFYQANALIQRLSFGLSDVDASNGSNSLLFQEPNLTHKKQRQIDGIQQQVNTI